MHSDSTNPPDPTAQFLLAPDEIEALHGAAAGALAELWVTPAGQRVLHLLTLLEAGDSIDAVERLPDDRAFRVSFTFAPHLSLDTPTKGD